jgi:hypothetical protein
MALDLMRHHLKPGQQDRQGVCARTVETGRDSLFPQVGGETQAAEAFALLSKRKSLEEGGICLLQSPNRKKSEGTGENWQREEEDWMVGVFVKRRQRMGPLESTRSVGVTAKLAQNIGCCTPAHPRDGGWTAAQHQEPKERRLGVLAWGLGRVGWVCPAQMEREPSENLEKNHDRTAPVPLADLLWIGVE